MFDHLFDSYENSTCIIIGNGPSLKNVPNSFLESFPTFGANRVYLKFVPSFYVCVNQLVVEQNWLAITALDSLKFIREGSGIGDAYELHSSRTPMFSFNPSAWIYEGHTVTFVSMQLAFFMGFTDAILVGVDHRFVFEGQPNEERIMEHDDPNHFDPSYFKGMRWNNPDLERSEQAYRMAKEVYEANGRRIINMTEDSALTVFEREEPVWAP
jgi:hypothetical protein